MKLIDYYRASTKRQGDSGLGFEAQQADVQRHAAAIGGEIAEIETGKRSDRPELAKALAACRGHGATLVIPRLKVKRAANSFSVQFPRLQSGKSLLKRCPVIASFVDSLIRSASAASGYHAVGAANGYGGVVYGIQAFF